MMIVKQEPSSSRPPVSLYTAAIEDPSSQAWTFSDALVKVCDGIVSQLGEAVILDPAAVARG